MSKQKTNKELLSDKVKQQIEEEHKKQQEENQKELNENEKLGIDVPDALTDSNGKKYTKDNLLTGIVRFSFFGGGGFSGAGGPWYDCVQQMGKWYEANIHTYQGSTARPRAGRKTYFCNLINGNVQDDCSSFVRACLQLFGVNCPEISTATMQEGSAFMKLMSESGFQHTLGTFTPDNLQPGDIICGKAATHTEIYAGDRKSWGWGNIHDGVNGRPGMPCGFCRIDSKGGYIHCWRKI